MKNGIKLYYGAQQLAYTKHVHYNKLGNSKLAEKMNFEITLKMNH